MFSFAFSMLGLMFVGCEKKMNTGLKDEVKADSSGMNNKLSEDEIIKRNLAKFDTLDFKVFSKRD